jgi:hypothetical protein
MIRKATNSIKAAANPAGLTDKQLAEAIYGHATMFAAGRRVDEAHVAALREEAERRAT